MSDTNNPLDRFKITKADESHYDDIIALIKSPDELFLIYPAGNWPFDRSQLQSLALQRSDLTVVLDARHVIGFANIYRNNSGDKFFIGNVVISEACRGKGLGRRLVQHMCDLIFDHYASTVHISVFNFNTKALLLYTKLGFRPYEIELHTMPNGDNAALIHMRLDSRNW
ncbi:MAG: GNAT family N-acetyltransferase [Candidatus Thiodiazotropha sp.]